MLDLAKGLRHYYHVYCDGPWRPIAAGHVNALVSSGAKWNVTVGLVGSATARTEAKAWFRMAGVASFIEADSGWEQVTLSRLHEWAAEAPPDEPVMYAHSKGVTHVHGTSGDIHAKAWRESMTRHVVGEWRACLELLAARDAVGCHWLTPDVYPGINGTMFGGNFWWANAAYLASLPPPRSENRYQAETWIGEGPPRVADLRPGFPNLEVFLPELADRWDGTRKVDVLRINAGCGEHRPEGWTNVDVRAEVNPDVVADLSKLPFADGSAQRIFASHVLEHLDYWEEVPAVLAEFRRVLEPDGELCVVGPDIERAVLEGEPHVLLRRIVKWGPEFYAGKLVTPPVGHAWTATSALVERALEGAGFTVTSYNGRLRLLERYGWPQENFGNWQNGYVCEKTQN